jgi:hypothetical protein
VASAPNFNAQKNVTRAVGMRVRKIRHPAETRQRIRHWRADAQFITSPTNQTVLMGAHMRQVHSDGVMGGCGSLAGTVCVISGFKEPQERAIVCLDQSSSAKCQLKPLMR